MKIKKFQAKDFREALALVKKEMGDDAIILSSEEKRGIRPGVEVTAAVDYEAGVNSNTGTDQTYLNTQDRITYGGEPGTIGEIKKEIEGLKEALEDMKNKGYEVTLPEKKRKIFHYLKKRSIREDLALKLCEKAMDAKKLSELLSVLSMDIRTYEEENNRKVVILIGSTGVGKTTTIAKLAARAIKKGKRVAIINLDTYRIGAIEQIRIYSKIMGIPLDIASDGEELKKSLAKHMNRDIIFVDTAGRNPKDEAYIDELSLLYNPGFPIETHLLISANSDDAFMVESYNRYKRLPVDCIAFTKVDEAVQLGSLYNISALCQKPVAYITTGQRVPDDIEFPDSKRIASMVLESRVA